MTAFLIGAIVLLVGSVVFLTRPLLKPRSQTGATAAQSALTLDILRDQQAELKQEHALGNLSDEAYATAHAELQRRLLDEVGDPPSAATTSAPSLLPRHTALALIVLIPLFAALGYALLGNPVALNPEARAPQQQMTPDKIAAMVDRLANRLKEDPSDLDGWLRLAQAYIVMGRYGDAADAYAKAESKVNTDPNLLAAYAEALAMSGETGLKGKPTKLVAKALQLDPNNPRALLLAGAIAMENKNPKMAVTIWEKLLTMVEPGSEEEQMLTESIDRIRAENKLPPRK